MSATADCYIVGAGGFGLEVLQYTRDALDAGWKYRAVGFLDDVVAPGTSIDGDQCVVGPCEPGILAGKTVVIALGSPTTRRALAHRVALAGGTIVTLVHPTAYIAPSASIGEGSLLCPFTLVGVRATIEANVAMNVYASVGHESTIGADCVLSPYSAILGNVTVGPECFVGTHATVTPGVIIGSSSKLSAGAVAYRHAPPGSLVAGNPGRGRVMFRPSPAAPASLDL